MDRQDLARILRSSRTEAGLTQVEIASRIGTTQAAVARAESGRVMPTLDLVGRWADATGSVITLQLGAMAEPIAGADIAPSGVDRDQIRHLRSISPDARLRGLRNAARFLARQRPLLKQP